jgi:hypothetical protein
LIDIKSIMQLTPDGSKHSFRNLRFEHSRWYCQFWRRIKLLKEEWYVVRPVTERRRKRMKVYNMLNLNNPFIKTFINNCIFHICIYIYIYTHTHTQSYCVN